MSFENGLFLNMDYKLTEIYRKLVRSQLRIYENLDDYIRDHSTDSDVQLDNFRNLFHFFFYLYILILLAFILNFIIKAIKTITDKMIRKLLNYFYVNIFNMIRYLNDLVD